MLDSNPVTRRDVGCTWLIHISVLPNRGFNLNDHLVLRRRRGFREADATPDWPQAQVQLPDPSQRPRLKQMAEGLKLAVADVYVLAHSVASTWDRSPGSAHARDTPTVLRPSMHTLLSTPGPFLSTLAREHRQPAV
jgi:hypothetical protein